MKRPLVFVVLTVAVGLICGFFLQGVLTALFLALLVLLGMFLLLKQPVKIILIATGCFVFGLLLSSVHLWKRPVLPASGRMIATGRVISVPKERENDRTLILKTDSFQIVTGERKIKTWDTAIYLTVCDPLGEETLSVGDTIRIYGTFSAEKTRKRIYGTLTAAHIILENDRLNNVFVRFSRSCSEKLNRQILRYYSGQTAALISAVLTGDQSSLSTETRENFSRAGLSHLVAVSGLHISIFLGIFTYILFYFPRRWRLVLSLPLLLFLVVFTGASPSILRAAIMSAVFLAADLQGRDPDGLTALFFAAGLLILLDYDILYDLSFQLSFLSVLGLMIGVPLLTHPFFTHRIGKVLAPTIMAQAGTLPVTVAIFGQLYPYAVFTNLLMVPLFPVVVWLCLSALATVALFPPVGMILVSLSEKLVMLYLSVNAFIGKLPGAVVDVGDVSGEVGVFLACLLIGGYLLIKQQDKDPPA